MIKRLILGEAWGVDELSKFRETGKPHPFVGEAGKELDHWLSFAGIDRNDCYLTNVFNLHPPNNKVSAFFTKSGIDVSESLPNYREEGRLRSEYVGEIHRLYAELDSYKPDYILALGATALWALTGNSGITAYRGTWQAASPTGGVSYWVLPTFHPAYILRGAYDKRVFACHDTRKFAGGYRAPRQRKVYVAESVADADTFYNLFITQDSILACDIETSDKVDQISIAPSPDHALVCDFREYPFLLPWVAWLLHQSHTKVFQNCVFDLTWLADHGIKVMGRIEDTMLMSHAAQPELSKDLGTLASMRLNEPAWKVLGRSEKDEE